MGYQLDNVRSMIRHQFGGIWNLAASREHAQGGSSIGQHEDFIQFWQRALQVLDELDNGSNFYHSFAEAELARHEAERAKLRPELAPYLHIDLV